MELKFRDRKGNIVIKPREKEVLDRISVYGIAMLGNKIFLVNPTWKDELELPGGGIQSEKIQEGLKREFLEETGFPIIIVNETPIKTATALFYADDINTFFNSKLLFYLVEINGERDPSLINRNEIKEGMWYDLDKLKKDGRKINNLHLQVIKEAIQKLKGY